MNSKSFENFTRAGDVRHGLPAFAYTSEEFHALENECLFSRSWVFAGFAHEIPERGDVLPIEVAGRPVLLVRGEDGARGGNGNGNGNGNGKGKITAFHNVCRHRCLKLVDQPGNVGRLIRCPYHSWTYDLSGALRASPFFGGVDNQTPVGFDRKQNGLATIRCAVWHDWIFVNLDGNALSFEEFIQPLSTRLAHLDLTRMKPVTMLDFGLVNTNWKFLMENFIEPYHVQFVHSTTTDQPLTDHAAFIDRHCLGCTVEISANKTHAEQPEGDTLAVDSSFLTLFPNFVLATYAPDQLGVHLNTPTNASQTSQRRVIYLLRDGDVPTGEIDALRDLWWKVHEEDHAMCERLQLGRKSAVADGGGWLSPVWEISVRRFQEMVYDSIAHSMAHSMADSIADPMASQTKQNPSTRGQK